MLICSASQYVCNDVPFFRPPEVFGLEHQYKYGNYFVRLFRINGIVIHVSRKMLSHSILEFFKPKDGLPDPQGSLSRAISSEAIEMVNREVENVHAKKVRGPYKRYVVFTRRI